MRRIFSLFLSLLAVVLFLFSLAPARKGLAAANTAVTFSKDVAPIFYKNCAACHRPGEIAPMSLLSYKDARPWARSIREKVVSHTMPPWHADPRYGHYANDRSLSQHDIDTIT